MYLFINYDQWAIYLTIYKSAWLVPKPRHKSKQLGRLFMYALAESFAFDLAE